MKKLAVFILVALLAFQANAQKIKKTSGELGFLKGVEMLDVSYTYDNLKVGKMTEADYIQKKMKKADENEPGAGEKWKGMWYEDRTAHFEPKFEELFNQYAKDDDVFIMENVEGAEYKLIVKTTFIEPGMNVGVAKKNASINLELVFVPVGDESKILARFLLLNSPGRSMGYGDYDVGIRVGEAYAKAAKEFVKYLQKQKAF